MSARSGFPTSLLWLLASVAPAAAQVPAQSVAVDPRWSAWLGCWQQLEDSVRSQSVPDALADREPRPVEGVMVCVTPADSPAAVTFRTIVEQQSALEETVVADGSSQPVTGSGCQGSQRARWSDNGRRLFARAELVCSDGGARAVSGLTTLGPGPMWVDIQVVNADGRESIRVRRYRRSLDQTRVTDRLTREQLANAAAAAVRQATPFTLDDVEEAVANVSPSTVEAALVETGSGFPLNAKRLRELAAAGVPDHIIDLMIALSFPNRFVVERRTASVMPLGVSGGAGSGLWIDPAYAFFPYYYAPFGYGTWGGYDSYYYLGTPTYVQVESPGIQASGHGRVVDGLGYTRVRSRDPQPTSGASGFGDGSGSSSAGGSSGGGGVSSQGYSGGGGDGGRTAVARPPG